MITSTYQGYTMVLVGTKSTTIWLKYYQHRFSGLRVDIVGGPTCMPRQVTALQVAVNQWNILPSC